MSIDREELARIAALAALDVDDAGLDALAGQVSRILDYVSQLRAVAGEAGVTRPGRAGAPPPLRPDVVRPPASRLDPREFAPAFEEGLFLVPRVGDLGEDDA